MKTPFTILLILLIGCSNPVSVDMVEPEQHQNEITSETQPVVINEPFTDWSEWECIQLENEYLDLMCLP